MTDEEFVRAHCDDSVLDPSSEGEHIFFHIGDCAGWNFATWSSAAAYVRERLEQVRQLTYEISLLKLIHAQGDRSEWHPIDHEDDQDALLRSSRRLESILADLKRGIRSAAQEAAGGD